MLVGCCIGDSKNHFKTVPNVSKQEASKALIGTQGL